jgi:predicted DNA-binding protein (MmcQ/YjbR family)
MLILTGFAVEASEPKGCSGKRGMSEATDDILRELRAFGRTYPGAHGKSPWPGHDDLAVNDKIFAFLAADGQPFSMSCKLKYTSEAALELPFAAPTGYGLGRSGWVTFTPSEAEMPSLDQLREWVDESYRAVAPKKLVKELDAREG